MCLHELIHGIESTEHPLCDEVCRAVIRPQNIRYKKNIISNLLKSVGASGSPKAMMARESANEAQVNFASRTHLFWSWDLEVRLAEQWREPVTVGHFKHRLLQTQSCVV